MSPFSGDWNWITAYNDDSSCINDFMPVQRIILPSTRWRLISDVVVRWYCMIVWLVAARRIRTFVIWTRLISLHAKCNALVTQRCDRNASMYLKENWWLWLVFSWDVFRCGCNHWLKFTSTEYSERAKIRWSKIDHCSFDQRGRG